ncbi:hypothetical protein CMQ_6945 [Grosmannia clavigera kw1407]|uniref:F-box domain-containing protein n=1 Tax=Grosmannia clavigera (strain kw1407 / UAMH 11150) TaxID=655863 RepID=F0X7I7_GROCL|nr:uncharacterized protein CMQ_6945 [Grosmannia clavigera kw1407]EFX06624.1 hypothetical protein CMQ_6945 [Grosmannia clavigera kw1407]
MSIITKLPCEIVNAVLQHVGSLQNLSSALLTCHHVHTSFQENPHVAADILQRQIAPELLPYAIAVMEGSRLGPRTAPKVQTLLNKLNGELYTESQEAQEFQIRTLASQLATMPFPLLSQMSHTHDVIHSFVMGFSTSAWTHLSSRISPAQSGESVSLSSKEYIRFCRAFYRMELYFRYFPRSDSPDEETSCGASFLRTFPAWENEQIGCVQDFFELQFSKASRDIVAHDVFFGEMSVDYLTPGYMNYSRQTWLYAEDRRVNDTPLEDYSKEKRDALFEPSEPRHDVDRGPFEAWWAANKELPLHSSLMMNHNAGFREQAYVLWDEDRLKRYSLLELFSETAPESELELEDTENEHDVMEKSFDARSEIYQKGGRGYWSNDDEHRISWPEGFSGQ